MLRGLAWAAALIWPWAGAHADPSPARVVSINLCTDQLAMLIADTGQLVSVSHLATDPRSSAMVEQARAYPANSGLAEEIYLMQPDLVLAGEYGANATVDMLRRLDVPVLRFEQAYSLDDVRARMIQMGEVLGRQDRAAELVDRFDARLGDFQAEIAARPRAALYYANGYTLGDKSLAGQILTRAGFDNVAADIGYEGGGVLPLELLAMNIPDAVVTGQPYPGASRSEEIMDHPVVSVLRRQSATASVTDSDWVCGTPFVLDAVSQMTDLRQSLTADRP
ncbi:ABC transporter substrate-binding protein [Sedimentitalea sp. JM2-8]|uniref:ABC transporter substrate-binding protein n=1 Tax=Sedimentitalea xiamensis TaxID=3050037 RepID=A0ABT7FHT8_9RHOB|nr:ABC transporter substrate-binding protein [Sedimentitalea xiamensis]MDK3074704.1 ABC transporter substrate-binding protein [Sedimentitalea xiamensis]